MTEDIEIDIIEMKKLSKHLKNAEKPINKELEYWVKFITKPDEVEGDVMEEVEEIELAKEELDKIRQDAHDKRLAELREKYIRDQKAVELYGYHEGLEAGTAKGIATGKREKAIAIAKKMLELNADVEFVKECTGISKKEITELQQSLD